MGRRFSVKLKYDDERVVIRNITLNQIFSVGTSENVYIHNLPKGKIKSIEIYSIDVCPAILVGRKYVDIEV